MIKTIDLGPDHQWRAWREIDGQPVMGATGYGRTRQEAIDDLANVERELSAADAV